LPAEHAQVALSDIEAAMETAARVVDLRTANAMDAPSNIAIIYGESPRKRQERVTSSN